MQLSTEHSVQFTKFRNENRNYDRWDILCQLLKYECYFNDLTYIQMKAVTLSLEKQKKLKILVQNLF